MLIQSVTGIFDVLQITGWIIGGFSILVGGFGIANILFVSVKERTNLIGIQKSLGAKKLFHSVAVFNRRRNPLFNRRHYRAGIGLCGNISIKKCRHPAFPRWS